MAEFEKSDKYHETLTWVRGINEFIIEVLKSSEAIPILRNLRRDLSIHPNNHHIAVSIATNELYRILNRKLSERNPGYDFSGPLQSAFVYSNYSV